MSASLLRALNELTSDILKSKSRRSNSKRDQGEAVVALFIVRRDGALCGPAGEPRRRREYGVAHELADIPHAYIEKSVKLLSNRTRLGTPTAFRRWL